MLRVVLNPALLLFTGEPRNVQNREMDWVVMMMMQCQNLMQGQNVGSADHPLEPNQEMDWGVVMRTLLLHRDADHLLGLNQEMDWVVVTRMLHRDVDHLLEPNLGMGWDLPQYLEGPQFFHFPPNLAGDRLSASVIRGHCFVRVGPM
jgi:hypothetical protein